MTVEKNASYPTPQRSATLHDLLMRLDLATEVLEGMDELGVKTRLDLESLLAQLERQIADAEPES